MIHIVCIENGKETNDAYSLYGKGKGKQIMHIVGMEMVRDTNDVHIFMENFKGK